MPVVMLEMLLAVLGIIGVPLLVLGFLVHFAWGKFFGVPEERSGGMAAAACVSAVCVVVLIALFFVMVFSSSDSWSLRQ